MNGQQLNRDVVIRTFSNRYFKRKLLLTHFLPLIQIVAMDLFRVYGATFSFYRYCKRLACLKMNYNDKIPFFYVLSSIEVKEIGVGSLI